MTGTECSTGSLDRRLQFRLTARRRGLAAVASGLGAFVAAAVRNWRGH
jgi:hypothetical protein